MAIGTTNLAATPCCGVIQRTWEAVPDELSPTGMSHTPGVWGNDNTALSRTIENFPGPYAPNFNREQTQLSQGICPDCGRSFVDWLRANGGRETRDGCWRWDYGAAERAYAEHG